MGRFKFSAPWTSPLSRDSYMVLESANQEKIITTHVPHFRIGNFSAWSGKDGSKFSEYEFLMPAKHATCTSDSSKKIAQTLFAQFFPLQMLNAETKKI